MLGLNDTLGYEQIKGHFRNAMQTGKVSHACILSDEADVGRESLANASALSLLCEKGTAKPYTQCYACKQVLSGSHPDLIYVIHKKPASIGVDDIGKQVNDTTQIRLCSSYYKIYVVDEAEGMIVQTQNTLLKTIEGPPAYAVIPLLTASQGAFLPTTLPGRIQLKLKPLEDSVVKEYLAQSLGENENEADTYTAFARDSLGKAIHLAQSEEFGVIYKEILHLLKHIKDTNVSGLPDYIHKVKEENLDIRECLDLMQMWYRDILMHKTAKDISLLVFRDKSSTTKSIGTTSGYDGLEKILEAIDKARIKLNANVNTELVIELVPLTTKENQNVSGL